MEAEVKIRGHTAVNLKHATDTGACSVMTDSLQPHGLQPGKFLRPWGFPGKNQTHVSYVSCFGRQIRYRWDTWEAYATESLWIAFI